MELEQQTKRPLIETYAVPILIVAIGAGFLAISGGLTSRGDTRNDAEYAALQEKVMPSGGVELPVVWGDLGKRLVESGSIDREKFVALYGSLSEEESALLDRGNPERMRITRENAPYLLNLLWAFGLANKNSILEEGEMSDPAYGLPAEASAQAGGAGGFASTGGWPLAKGGAMEHYSMHSFTTLTPEEHRLVEQVSKNIYRPCCGNSTHFPDCNHGMAMLGLLELMASQGVSKEEMYKAALAVNSYWFPDTYLTIATYMGSRGIEWSGMSPREVLSAEYSSAGGYSRIAAQVAKIQGGSGTSCGT